MQTTVSAGSMTIKGSSSRSVGFSLTEFSKIILSVLKGEQNNPNREGLTPQEGITPKNTANDMERGEVVYTPGNDADRLERGQSNVF